MNTGMDDQKARCEIAEQEGWGIVLEQRTPKLVNKSVNNLINTIRRTNITVRKSGARELAEILNIKMEEFND
jgi:hypothetical protein